MIIFRMHSASVLYNFYFIWSVLFNFICKIGGTCFKIKKEKNMNLQYLMPPALHFSGLILTLRLFMKIHLHVFQRVYMQSSFFLTFSHKTKPGTWEQVIHNLTFILLNQNGILNTESQNFCLLQLWNALLVQLFLG